MAVSDPPKVDAGRYSSEHNRTDTIAEEVTLNGGHERRPRKAATNGGHERRPRTAATKGGHERRPRTAATKGGLNAYADLFRTLDLYRMVFDQNRQEDLVQYLLARLPQVKMERIAEISRVDLSPV